MVSDEDAFFSDFPMVLSVSRLQQQPDTVAAAVTVIDRETIRASGARTIPQVLRLVPGFQVGSVNGYTSSVTYHGLADEYSRRMQVLLDGQSVFNRLVGGVSWEVLPVDVRDIERIEVVRGPNSVTYGANAFLGVINIITRHPGAATGTHASVNAGSDGILDGWVAYNRTFEGGAFGISAAQVSDDGIEDRFDDSTHRHVRLSLDYSITPADTLELKAGLAHADLQDGREGSDSRLPHSLEADGSYALLRWRHTHDGEAESVLHAYAARTGRDEIRDGLALAHPIDTSGDTTRYEIEFYQIREPTQELSYVWGGSARRDVVDVPFFFNGENNLHEDLFQLFTSAEWQLKPDTIVNAGVLWEHNEFTGSEVDYRLGVNYRIAPRHTVRAAVSTAARTPIFFEERGDVRLPLQGAPEPVQAFVGNPDLDAESIRSVELGYLYSRNDMTLDLRLFQDDMDNLIRPIEDPMTMVSSWIGDGEVRLRGAEAQLDWRPTDRARLLASYSYVDAESDEPDLEDSTPRHTASLFGSYRLDDGWQLSAGYYYTSPFRWLGLQNEQPTMRWLDLRVAKTFSIGSNEAEIALVGQNLLGDTRLFLNGEQEGMQTVTNELGSRVYGTFSISF